VIFGFWFNNSSRAYSSGRLRASDFFASCGAVSDLLRPSKRFSCASYLAVPERGGVSFDKPPAREGTMSSILLLPEQAASTLPKINNATMRIMTGGLRGRSFTCVYQKSDSAILVMKTCVCRKSDSAILVMKASKERLGCDDAEALNRPMERGILVQRAMNARFIIISGILA
jgi:hypothetical protein